MPPRSYQQQSAAPVPPAKKPPSYVRSLPLECVVIFLGAVLFIVVVLIVVDANTNKSSPPTKSAFTVGGSAAQTAPNVFIDDISIQYLAQILQELTDECNIASPTVPLVLGSYAATTASWTSAKDDLAAACDFYGLYSMEQRAGGQLEGPLDFCYAYSSVGFQIVQIYYNLTLPFDFLARLTTLYEIAYPLNLYWLRSTFTAYDVASAYLNQVQAYINAVRAYQTAPGSIQPPSIQPYQSAFCNVYFGQDDLTQYHSMFQPWLAFPFEGLIQKLADSYIINELQDILSPISPVPGTEFKAVYAVGQQFVGDEGVQLFAQTMLGGLPVQVVTDPPQIAVPAIQQSILNASMAPVFIFGTYTDNLPFYSAFDSRDGAVLFGFTENSNTQSSEQIGRDLVVTLAAALGARTMSAMDFATIHPYEILFGPTYITEKFVADLIVLSIGTYVNAQATDSDDILNTFAIKNTAVFRGPGDVYDIGGRLTQEQGLAGLRQEGVSGGMQTPAFSISLTESTPAGGNLTAASEILGAAPPKPAPSRFDWRDVRPDCIPPVINQGICSNCWAIGSTRSMSSRTCISQPSGSMPFTQFMSVFHVTTCSNLQQNKNGCAPQQASAGFTFMTGDVQSQQCMPTTLTGRTATGCQQQCNSGTGGSLADVSGIVGGSYAKLDNPQDIKTSLFNDGPLAVGMSITTGLRQFFPVNSPNSGVFVPSADDYIIENHMVMLVGYDDTALPPYWIVQNSWGPNNGQGGFLKLAQDPNGLAKRGIWPDRWGWIATPRPRRSATNPTTILFERATATNPTAARTLPTVSTSQLGCPNLVVNVNQSNAQASRQGCPNSAGQLTSTTTPVRTSGGNVIGGAGSAVRSYLMEMITMAAALIFLVM